MEGINPNNLAHLSDSILMANHPPLLIRLPAWQLMSRLLLFFAVGTLLLTLTFSLLAMVTIPILLYWSYLYYLYCHIWNRYRLSRVYIVAAPIFALSLAMIFRYLLYIL